MTIARVPEVTHGFVEVDGVRIFFRQAGPPDAPVLLLLHGFPSASHQFRRLFDALAGRYRLVAPDYPGFGHSDAPAPASLGGSFAYSFDRLADLVEGFCRQLGLDRFALYMFDFGAPVGFRVATRHPDWITGLVIQNANAYEEGLSAAARQLVASRPGDEETARQIRELITIPGIRQQYLTGAANPDRVAPDGWILDHALLSTPERAQIQVDLGLDYHSNVELYPQWQSWLRRQRPPALVVWGRHDPFFVEAGARAYRRDLPDAELHLFETGHFALEEHLPQIAPLIADFLDRLPA